VVLGELGVEVDLRVDQGVVEPVEVDAAVELVRAGLGHHVERRAEHVAVLGRGADVHDLHLLDRVRVDVDPGGAGLRGLGLDAVNEPAVGLDVRATRHQAVLVLGCQADVG
jgi:hypothetical protein